MTYRQKVLKAVYPAFVWWAKLTGGKSTKIAEKKASPYMSFYDLKDTLIDGTPVDFSTFKGKQVLLVNTASDCGYTNQYADLEKLYSRYHDTLILLGFPANDFKEQEKGDNAAIASFCKLNYGVSFMLMKKSSVVKSVAQNPVYAWLTDPAKNGWNNEQPSWNFCKYLVDKEGKLTHFFGSAVEPMSKEIINAIHN